MTLCFHPLQTQQYILLVKNLMALAKLNNNNKQNRKVQPTQRKAKFNISRAQNMLRQIYICIYIYIWFDIFDILLLTSIYCIQFLH